MRKKFYKEEELVFVEKSTHCRFKDMDGQKIGRLTVIGFSGRVCNDVYWFCKCDCGNVINAGGQNLRSGETRSCGCYQVDRARDSNHVHGHSSHSKVSRTYKTWASMLERCRNPNSIGYHNYGGRGITVCERWEVFENFLEDMGERPKGMSIERKENNKGYYESNCRWATRKEQNNNKRNNHLLSFQGRTRTIAQWADEIGMDDSAIFGRIKRGWTTERILTAPIIKNKQ